jgi:hypothetical protein
MKRSRGLRRTAGPITAIGAWRVGRQKRAMAVGVAGQRTRPTLPMRWGRCSSTVVTHGRIPHAEAGSVTRARRRRTVRFSWLCPSGFLTGWRLLLSASVVKGCLNP